LVALVTLLGGCQVPIARAGWQDAGGAEVRDLTLRTSAGGVASSALSFYPADNESTGLAVKVGGDPPAPEWVSVDPERIPSIDAGVAVPIRVSARVPAGTSPGTYQASVSLLTGSKPVTRLPVKIIVS
jgi:hypothetical protein